MTEAAPSTMPQPSDSGQMPTYFTGRGLDMLRQGDFSTAINFYRYMAETRAVDAQGWIGLGTALIGTGHVNQASTYLLKGLSYDPSFPLNALLADIPALEPSTLLALAQSCVRHKTPPALDIASLALTMCLAHPTTPRQTYVTADTLQRQIDTKRQKIRVGDHICVASLSEAATHDQRMIKLAKLLGILSLLSAVGSYIWYTL